MAFNEGYALVIGVGSYKYIPSANVPISLSDALAVSDVLRDTELCGYPRDQVKVVHDADASREGILDALEELATKTNESNTVVLFYCGHGANGTDGNYYLTTHDTKESKQRVVAGTGIQEAELLEKLRAIPAQRFLMLFNACHSGEISPDLGFGEEESFGDLNLPTKATDALLSTGEGRIIITASRPEQKSWIGKGELSIYTQALVDGLSGRGYVSNNNGYVSAFSLYESMYVSIRETAEALGKTQEPELTILRGVGPFPVSLYQGAASLGSFAHETSTPADTAVREVDSQHSARLLQQYIQTAEASGDRAVAVGGDVKDSTINTGDQQTVDTGGGAHVGGSVNTGGGDFVGRDQTTFGDKVSGDKVGGDKIEVGDISGTGIAVGRGAQSHVSTGLSGEELEQLFAPLMQTVQESPQNVREQAVEKAEELEHEVAKGEKADDTRMANLIDGLVELVPGAVSAVTSIFVNPVLAGLTGPVTKFVLDKIQGK